MAESGDGGMEVSRDKGVEALREVETSGEGGVEASQSRAEHETHETCSLGRAYSFIFLYVLTSFATTT